jgi:prolyl-tRNA synthetase
MEIKEKTMQAFDSNESDSEAESSLAKWYTDTILQSQLADYAPVRGCMIIRPYGYALWENIQQALDRMIKDTGHQNAYFPVFIPESFLNKEKEHVEGFAPECAVVTHGGGKKLEEPLIIRPTSETIINHSFAKWVQSWRDLPILINQWANVVRWEMRTKLFMRTTEFLWQEGHTAHATEQEAQEEAKKMLQVYKILAEEYLAVPVIDGEKTARERFAGAVNTYSIEAHMQDGKALQAGTSHFLGQNFAKAFEIQFQNAQGNLEYAWQTSWGASTRLIGAIILSHGDKKGLILPPKVAPIQVVVVPIYKTDDEKTLVLNYCESMAAELKGQLRIHIDARDNLTPGFKFNDWELKGVPLRINIGPRDVSSNVVEIVRRDSGEKIRNVARAALSAELMNLLQVIQKNLYNLALSARQKNTYSVKTYSELKSLLAEKNCFIEAFWAGSDEDEAKIKEETKATIRVIPFEQPEAGPCFYTGKSGGKKIVLARAY